MKDTSFIKRWLAERKHIARWVHANITNESATYHHHGNTATAVVFVRDYHHGYGEARCNSSDKPDKRIGFELARSRAIDDVVTQMLLERIERDTRRKMRVAAITNDALAGVIDKWAERVARDADRIAELEAHLTTVPNTPRDYNVVADADMEVPGTAILDAIQNDPTTPRWIAQDVVYGVGNDAAITPDGRTEDELATAKHNALAGIVTRGGQPAYFPSGGEEEVAP
jgi:hypothetical protein